MESLAPSDSRTQTAETTPLTAQQKRRLLIRMAQRRIRPGAGSSTAFKQRRTATLTWPDLRPILYGIQWVFAGDMATRAFMPERMTNDLDILIREMDETAVLERLRAANYTIESELSQQFQLWWGRDGAVLPWAKQTILSLRRLAPHRSPDRARAAEARSW